MKKLVLLSLIYTACKLNAQVILTLDKVSPNAGNCNGSITASIDGSIGVETYQWSNGQTGSVISNLCADLYCVTVIDPNRCERELPCEATGCIDLRIQDFPCTITSTPNGNIALTGGNPLNLYLGYGPQSTTLSAGSQTPGTYSYAWSPSTGLSCTTCATPVFTPTAQGNYTFTAVLTNTITGKPLPPCTITICVLDIRASSGNSGNGNGHQNGTGNGSDKKVYVCHLPPGNPANVQDICISVNGVPAHVPLHGGDHLGRCNQVCGSSKNDESVPELLVDENGSGLEILLYPNPFNSQFQLQLESESTQPFTVKLFDVSGKLVEEQNELNTTDVIKLGNNLSSGMYMVHVKQGDNVRIIRVTKSE